MNKCDINSNTLRQIETLTTEVLEEYLDQEESLSTLRQNMGKLFEQISNEYELTDINSIVEAIYSTAEEYAIVEIAPDFFSRDNIASRLAAINSGVQVDTSEASTEHLTDSETVQSRLEANREFLDNAFGLAKEVKAYMVQQANQNLFDCCFINRGSVNQRPGIVRNTTELNRNIRDYQEELLRRVTGYLKWVSETYTKVKFDDETKQLLENPQLYREVNGKIVNTGILERLSGFINTFLSPTRFFSADDLRTLYNTANDTTASPEEKTKAKRKLDAYNANLLLKHFDTYLSITLGKAIQIKDFNRKTGEDKYQIAGKTASLTATWRTSENINVEAEADAITKMAINTTPLYRWQEPAAPVSNHFLHFSDFEHTIAKLKDLSYNETVMGIVFDEDYIDNNEQLWDSLSQETQNFIRGKRLSTVINLIRRNPKQYLHSIFEIFSSPRFYDKYQGTLFTKSQFTQDELDKLYSLAKGIFNLTSDTSLNSLVSRDSESDTDFYAYITQTADSIFKVNYVQYYKDNDGIIQVRTLIDQGVNNIRRQIEQTINTVNSGRLIKDWKQFKEDLHLIKPISDKLKIQYDIPNTDIRVTVTASSGAIRFTSVSDPSKTINNFEELWQSDDVKDYIDKILRLGITSSIDLQNALQVEAGNFNDLCKDLLSFAGRVTLNQYVSNEIIKGMSNEGRDYTLQSIYGDVPAYNYTLNELGLVHKLDVPTLQNIAIAKANVQGITIASQVKDGEGNGQSNQTLSRLLGSLQSQFEMQERQPWSATKDSLIVSLPGLYEGVYTSKEFHNQSGDNKANTAFSVSEMSYAGIVQDFIGGIMERSDSKVVGNGHVLFLPSVNSDKGTIGRLKINLNKTVEINGVQKAIKDLDSYELQQLISDELGTIYINMFNAVREDWNTLTDYIRQEISDVPNISDGLLDNFQFFNNWWMERATAEDPITGQSIGEQFKKRFGNSPAAFIKHFTLQYNQNHRLNPLSIIDQVHYKAVKEGGVKVLRLNQAFISQIARFKPRFLLDLDLNFNLSQFPTAGQFFELKKIDVLKGLIKANFRINTTGTTQKELLYIRAKYPQWINKSGDVVLARYYTMNPDGTVASSADITSKRDLIRLAQQYNIQSTDANAIIDGLRDSVSGFELNPFIEQYNYLDYLFTQEFMCATVGSFIVHPEQSGSNNVLEQEAAHFQAQHKRNVSFTAAMHAFQLNLLNGIPEQYNLAVIDDITDEQGTILGLNNGIKPFDGATFVNPFVVILENNSLGGARAGITKKQFVHFKNERTGTGGIIKTAGFGLTNDWIRNSPFLERMMRKMTDHVWLNEDGTPAVVDINRNYKGESIQYEDWYFKDGNRAFRIKRIESLGNNMYRRVLEELKPNEKGQFDGTLLNPQEIVEEPVTVNTNYKLWNLFGGKNSMTKDGSFLKLSNTSVSNVVTAMNNIGTRRGEGKIKTQDQLWQPLKQVDVHYLATAGAVKQGAANINSADKYSNNEAYDTQRINMYQAGIQLDKEHHADDSELSLMTQVISACAAKGYTLDGAIGLYEALRRSTEIGTKDHLGAVKALFTDGSEQSIANFQNVMMQSIVKALGTDSNTDNFAAIIASDLIRQAREGKEVNFAASLLPLSDNTVYAKVFSTVTSFLTNSGIKQKIPGILSVLTPSHDIFKLYAGRKYESFNNPEVELAELQAKQAPVFDGTNPNTISNIELGRTYIVTRIGVNEQGLQVEKRTSELIRTPTEYHKLREDVFNGTVINVIEDVTVGRNLAAYNVRFTTTDGQSFQLWDLDSAYGLFALNNLRDTADDLKKAYKKATTQEEKNAALQAMSEAVNVFSQDTFGTPWSPKPGERIEGVLNTFETRLRRWLQRDLMNLSDSTPSLEAQYQQLLSGRQNSREWFARYAQWVNIQLGCSDGSQINLGGQLYTVTEQNFDAVNQRVSRLLSNMTKVRIGKHLFDVDRSTIKTQAYELIMPKTFKTNFGLNEFDDLNTIKEDQDFFIKQYLSNRATKEDITDSQHTIEFKVSNGNHYYLLKKGSSTRGLTKVDDIQVYTEDGRTYRTDVYGNIMYEITPDTEIYVSSSGTEVIVSDNLSFYINGLHYDSIKLSNALQATPFVADEIVKIAKKSTNRRAKEFAEWARSYNNNGILASQALNEVSSKNYQSLIKTEIDPVTGETRRTSTNPLIRMGWAKHSSFLKSLDIVAARIPAQSMQSFMPMKVVAYDNPDINTAHVSTMQILLQGSDYDVDAVSLATYDINRNGLLQLWSPYANIESPQLMEASMTLPIPTGIEVTFQETDSVAPLGRFLQKYQRLFDRIGPRIGVDGVSPDEVVLDMNINSPEKILLLREFLSDIQTLQVPNQEHYSTLARALEASGIAENLTANHIPSLLEKLKRIADRHNLYFDTMPRYNLTKAVNNYTMFSMYRTISDPVNLIQAQTSVDGTTGPLKDEAKRNKDEEQSAKTRTPGNFVNKYESITENQVGKEAIGICAVGLKSFFGLSQYSNYVLNYGTSEQQSRLLFGPKHNGILFNSIQEPGKNNVFKTLANIRSKDPNTITNQDVLEALSSVTNDNDAALVLSALLSLATDNAKELTLSKLNAGTKMIGMYIYGITIGMDFRDVAKILMSDVGGTIKNLLDNDVFTERDGYSRVKYIFKYFDGGPKNILQKFDVTRDSKGTEIKSPLKYLEEVFNRDIDWIKDEDGQPLPFEMALVQLAKSSLDLSYKLELIENLRSFYNNISKEAVEIYSQAIDFIEDYIQQGHIIGRNSDVYEDIRTLSDGAEEMRRLGSILSLNQGIKTNSEGLLNQINLIERAIYDITGEQEDLISLSKFVFDEQYREQCINKYEEYKHTFNILDVVSSVPHFMGYLQTLAIAATEAETPFKFRSIKQLSLELSKQYNISREPNVIKGIQNFIGDWLRKQWMLSSDKVVIIPKGNKAFDPDGNQIELTVDTPVKLGTEWGDATFRMWMENEVIPNLKAGQIAPDISPREDVYNNRFVKDLGNDLLTNTVSRNPSIVYTLPINMLPRIDNERAILNSYMAEFDKLAELQYKYNVQAFDADGQVMQDTIGHPISDLFTYYAMIAHSWKLGEKSLVPIFGDQKYQNSGIIEDFHKFIGSFDQSGDSLVLGLNVDAEEILPYIVPFESPYSSYAQYIYYKNPSTQKYEIMRKLSKDELDQMSDMEDEYTDSSIIRGYRFQGEGLDTNYFPTGSIQAGQKRTMQWNMGKSSIRIQYDVDTGKVEYFTVDGENLDIPELSDIPTIKQNGIRKVNISLIESMINNKLNPCE